MTPGTDRSRWTALGRRLAERPGYALLTAGDDRLASLPPQRFSHAWLELMILGLGWGLALCGLWLGATELFGFFSGNIPLLPVSVVVAAHLLWLYRRSAAAVAGLLAPRDAAQRAVTAALLVWVLAAALLDQPAWNEDWPAWHLGPWAWVRPQVTYRTLLLMPLWGAWAMLLASQLAKADARTQPAVLAMARGCGPLCTSASMALPLALSVQYYNYLPWVQVLISAVPIACAIATSIVLGRLTGGLSRCTLLAANLLTQVAFLLAQVAVRHVAGF